jgi:hypothetical protein
VYVGNSCLFDDKKFGFLVSDNSRVNELSKTFGSHK